MGRDIHVRIISRDEKSGIWKQIKLYKKIKNKFKVIDIYPYRNYELFDILSTDDNFPSFPIAMIDIPHHLQQEIKKYQNITGYYGFKEVNLADLKLYLQRNPQVRNWDYAAEDDPRAFKDNPVKFFIERIEQYLDLSDAFWDCFTKTLNSNVRILYWFDC